MTVGKIIQYSSYGLASEDRASCPSCGAGMRTVGKRHMCSVCGFQQNGDVIERDPRERATQKDIKALERVIAPPSPDEREAREAEESALRLTPQGELLSTEEGQDRLFKSIELLFGVSKEELLARNRARRVVTARNVAMALFRECAKASTTATGKLFGDRNHTTVMRATSNVTRREKEDLVFRTKIEALRKAFS